MCSVLAHCCEFFLLRFESDSEYAERLATNYTVTGRRERV